ncbi:MAG: hypothetical protein AAGN82_25440 [Myxococcota bacterium]
MRGRRVQLGCWWSLVAAGSLLAGCGSESTPKPDPTKTEAAAPAEASPPAEPPAEAKEPAPAENAASGDEDDAAKDEAETTAAPEKQAAAPNPGAAAAAPNIAPAEAKKTAPTGPTVGQTSTVMASVKAEPGYHCNEAYPHKFVTAGGTNVTYPDPRPKGGCAGKDAISVAVPYVPTAAGSGSVAGTLRYGICDEGKTNCRVVKKPMTLPFTAGES